MSAVEDLPYLCASHGHVGDRGVTEVCPDGFCRACHVSITFEACTRGIDSSRDLKSSNVTHGRGFPGFGPPTLCGEGVPCEDVPAEITCPRCVELSGDGPKLFARLQEIEATNAALAEARKGRP